MTKQTERWDIFELELAGPADGNPFLDVQLSAQLSHQHRVLEVEGFYDGNGSYRVRFMPDTEGEWRYITKSNIAELNGVSGTFTCTSPSGDNHGPVYVENSYHFAYAGGRPYRQIGTTCYVWNHQGDALEAQTLETLKTAPFNKLRMCVFPKDYLWNKNEPPHYPFEGDLASGWDFTRFNPAYFQHLEKRVGDLRDLGIEADLILFHPYDRWGFATMDTATDDRYLRYVVARLAAYRNIWWSMANEYDLMKAKRVADWDRFFRIVQRCDPYQHLRSIHNCRLFYDYAKPWVTHASIQSSQLGRTREWRDAYRKPVVFDECRYEGNVPKAWGNISAEEMTHRFWEGTARGGYVGHGDTYLHPEDILWWSKGGVLRGQSPARIAFLKRVLDEAPEGGLEPIDGVAESSYPCVGVDGIPHLIYTSLGQPAQLYLKLPEGKRFKADILDTWEMTVSETDEVLSGECMLALPGKPRVAVRLHALN